MAINTPLDEIFPSAFGTVGDKSFQAASDNLKSFDSLVDSAPAELPSLSYSNAAYAPEDMINERLYTVMPRSAATSFTTDGVPTYTTERGQIASIRLLSSSRETSLAGREGKEINIDRELGTLLDDPSGYKNFFLTDVSVQYSEKLQITTTFGDNEVAYYFGRQPVIFNLSGMLMDSLYSDWFTKFLTLYQTTLRGSQLAKYFELVELVLPNMRVIGSIQGLTHQQNSARDSEIFFSFQFLAKEVIPTAIPELEGNMSNIVGGLIDFSVGKEGVGGFGYKLATGIGSGLQKGDYALGSIFSEVRANQSDIGREFSESLNAFRSSIFSPIYGIISSITKIIKTATGDISGIIKNFTDPVNMILKDVMYVATKAIAIANLIESSVNDVISIPDRVIQNARNTLQSLQNSAGVISRVPESVSEVFKRHFKNGRVKKGAAILGSGKANKKDKGAVLSSGAPYSPTTAYKI
jgi:hypothetical protein